MFDFDDFEKNGYYSENEEGLYDDGYEGVEEDDRDSLYYEYEYGSLIDSMDD